MEWVSGGALGRKVSLEGPQPVADVERWCRQILDVLAHLHDRRIVHRDVKPSNLLLDDANDVRLADLGLVRSLDTPSDLTRSSVGVGTPSYMAPEQLRGGPPQPSWDLYALGVTCYQLLTGVRPFAGDSEFETADAHLHRRPRALRSLRPESPRWFGRFVERLLAKRPEDRWPTAREALTAFERRRAGIAPTLLRRRVSAAAGALALGIAVVAGARLVLRSGGDLALLDVVDNQVVARDAAGEVLWRRRYARLVPVAMHGEMSPIPGSEALILASPRLDSQPPAHALLDVVTAHGETILSRELGRVSEMWFPGVSDLWQVMQPSLGACRA